MSLVGKSLTLIENAFDTLVGHKQVTKEPVWPHLGEMGGRGRILLHLLGLVDLLFCVGLCSMGFACWFGGSGDGDGRGEIHYLCVGRRVNTRVFSRSINHDMC